MTDVLLYMCACLEWTRRPTRTEECSVSCDTKISGKEERKDVRFPPLTPLLSVVIFWDTFNFATFNFKKKKKE